MHIHRNQYSIHASACKNAISIKTNKENSKFQYIVTQENW